MTIERVFVRRFNLSIAQILRRRQIKKLNLTYAQGSRLGQLLFLAAIVLSYSVMSIAVANSLFVSHVGAGNLPLAFIIIGLCSIPAYGLFSQIIDRYSRPRLFRYVLLASIAISLGLRLLLNIDNVAVYYILFIVIFFQWDFHNNILYPSLLTDYFTTLEYKRYAPYIGIAQAVGTLVGGGLTIFLSQYLITRDLLFCLPILLAIAFGQLLYLESSQRRLETTAKEKPVGMLESLKTFPKLIKSYPLVIFLASSSFLLVIIYISCEFLWFNIYGKNFNEGELTAFLGLMRIIMSLIQIMVLYGITRPLIQWLGVARLNSIYPITTFASLLGLLFNLNLPSAIALHINGDAFYKSINLPIHQLNYNGIPQEFMGRIRALSDGIIYSLGLTLAGVLLWICHLYLNLEQITYIGAGLTLLLLLLRLPMGKFYARSLEDMIRSDTINLEDFSDQAIQLPAESSEAIRELLINTNQETTQSNRYLQIRGLELAARIGNSSQFFPEIKQLIPQSGQKLRQAIVKLFATSPDSETINLFENLLKENQSEIEKITALEILIINKYQFSDEQLTDLLAEHNQEIKTLAAFTIIARETTANQELKKLAQEIWESPLDNSVAKSLVRVIAYSNDVQLTKLLEQILPQADADTKRAGLEALSKSVSSVDCDLAKLAVPELEHPEALVRVAAFQLLGVTRCSEMLPHLKIGLEDKHPLVRQQVAKSIAGYGKTGLTLAQENLTSPDPDVVNTAIAAIGQVRTKQASDILFNHLAPDFQQINKTRRWQQQLISKDPNWQLLTLAIEDYHQRCLQKVLYVLSCLGHSRTVNAVMRILATNDEKDLAKAVETLASISHRRFIAPLIPILEQKVKQKQLQTAVKSNDKWLKNKGYKILLEALASKDRWLKNGALIALAMIPSTLVNDPDPIVRLFAQEIFSGCAQPSSNLNNSMNRLLLLKNVALFKNLSLDELLSIDKALEQEQKLIGDTVYTEGSWATHFYIIAEGIVQIVKKVDGQQREIKQLSTGDYFGEIALFDDSSRWDGAIVLENCTLLKLEKKRFISLIAQRPHIILEMCRFLSKRLRETDRYLSSSAKSIE